MPVRESPPQPAPPPKRGGERGSAELARHFPDRWNIWTGIAAIALVVFLALLFIVPGMDDTADDPASMKVEKTTPAPNVTPNPTTTTK